MEGICSEVLLQSGVVENQIEVIVDAGRGRRMGSGETRRASKQPGSKQAGDGHGSAGRSCSMWCIGVLVLLLPLLLGGRLVRA